MVRRSLVALVVITLPWSAACGDGASGDDEARAAFLQPAGSPMLPGLVVPEGTALVALPLDRPDEFDAEPEASSTVLLEVSGDPFDAWDDLAAQAHGLGFTFQRSGICWWNGDEPADVFQPRPADTDVMHCGGVGYRTLEDGSKESVGASLWWWPAGAEMTVTLGPAQELPPGVGPIDEIEDPGPAPASARQQLPELEPFTAPVVGDDFGTEQNPFEEGDGGYDRFTVPDGAVWVGGGRTPITPNGVQGVLAVEDVDAVLQALLEQMDPTGPDVGGGWFERSTGTIDGQPVEVLDGYISAGGGGATIWSTPDGRFVVVSAVSD